MSDGQFSAVDGSALPAGSARPPSGDSRGGPGEREDFSKDPRFADQQLPQTTLLPLRSFTFLRLTQEMTSPAYQARRCSLQLSGTRLAHCAGTAPRPRLLTAQPGTCAPGRAPLAGPMIARYMSIRRSSMCHSSGLINSVVFPQGAWLRFMYRMQTSQAMSQWPEPHLGLRPWVPPPQPPRRSLPRQQSAPGSGSNLDRPSLQAVRYGRNSEGNLNKAPE